MGGQSMQRREALRILALAATASQFPGFDQWVYAHDHTHMQKAGAERPKKPYTPQFFEPKEYAVIERLTEVIIPSDGSPGSKEAGVAEFVDFMAASDPELQPRFRTGLGWMEAHAKRVHSRSLADLSAEQLIAILEPLAYKDRYRDGEEEGRAFFGLIREYTTMGFYSSRIGMEALDNPFLKQYYSELPGCPHPNDPEHKNLPKPRS